MNGMTAEQAKNICHSNIQLDKEETIKLQLDLFESLLKQYIYGPHTSFFSDFKLDTTRRFLPEVIHIIQERGFKIEEHIVQRGDPHDWHDYYPVGSVECTYGEFFGYMFSF